MAKDSLYRDKNLRVIFGVTLMAVLGISSIAPAFPSIIHELGITGGQVGLLITFFTLPSVILGPFLGMLADRFGRKRILVPSLFLFAIAGTTCTFIRDFNVLLIFRTLQGIGASGLGPMGMTIIGDLYSGRQRTKAVGLNESVLNIGVAFYPIIGGSLALLGWYYPFALSIIAVPIGILVLTRLKNPEPRSYQSLREYLGGTWGYLKNIRVIGLFAASVLTFIIRCGAYLTYFSLLLGESFGASSFIIGVIMSSQALTAAAVSSQLGRINRRFSLPTIIKLGFVVYALALVLIPLMPNLWLTLIPAIILGIAAGTGLPSIMTAVAELAPLEYRGAFMSINSTMIRLGQAIGPPLIGLLYIYGGFDITFFTTAALALIAPAVAIAFGRKNKLKVNNLPIV